MADGIYVSMNGAAARLAQLDSISDNLANTQTPGFKAQRPAFEAFLANAAGPQSDKVYPAVVGTRVDLSPGVAVHTGEPLDVTPEGTAFLAVRTTRGLAFTRDGHLRVEANGALMSGQNPVLDRHGEPIVAPPGSVVRIDAQGVVLASNQRLAELGTYELRGPVDRIAPSLLAPQSADDVVAVPPAMRLGELETGNSSPLEAVVQLVSAQRAYDASIQALQTSKQLDSRTSELGRVR
jgi:flagellar basal-body rod protein FlgF